MAEVRPTRGDGIDLLDFLETLWDGKWLIIASTALAALLGFVFLQSAQPKYKVSVSYNFNIYPVSVLAICGTKTNCLNEEVSRRLLFFLGGNWGKPKIRISTLSFSTTSPLEVGEYEGQFRRANLELTNEIYAEAKAELTLIQTELKGALLGTEVVARNLLNAKRIILSIDNGNDAVAFGPVSVAKPLTKTKLIFPLSVLTGGMIGVLFTLVRDAIKKRKEQYAKA